MMLSVIMYKNTGVSNTDIAFYTSWLYLPWVLKPFWSPLVDMSFTRRGWIIGLQFIIGLALALLALSLSAPWFFQLSLLVFWLLAFASATHDIAADGFYMLALKSHQQAAFVGVRSTFYRLAMITGQGALVYLAGSLMRAKFDVRLAWSAVFMLLAASFIGLALWHQQVLPTPAGDAKGVSANGRQAWPTFFSTFLASFAAFFQKKDILDILGFLLLFRLGEAQLLKLAVPFLLDPAAKGGLALSTAQVGLVYGTAGVLALTLGGLAGGVVLARIGLQRCLWSMVLAAHVPDLVFVYLASSLPGNLVWVAACLAAEQFGYGFGFAAYMMYMIAVSDGAHKSAHYAICTGFMALGMMLPGMISGWIEQQLGYRYFFIWACVATIPAFVMAARVRLALQSGQR